ncbi:PAS domain S-box protein [Rhodoferax sp.]|uniref:sensor histidine kinase n=1 Tax=Rhodoferax sp. TaxID=50421 RepID=UPI0025CFE9E2|nr:PAS domain S-box protein [Rhodoferax sp.]MCM2297134.1 PAS domain S-box protein [Rhodoferax sp.]
MMLASIFRSLSWRHLWRWGLLALVVGLSIILMGHWAERRELQIKTEALQQVAQANALGIRGIAEKHGYLPYAAARHPDVQSLLLNPSDSLLSKKVNQYFSDLKDRTESAALFVMSSNGMTLAASNWNSTDSFVGQSYQQRPYFKEALQGRRGFFYGVGLTTGTPGFFIAEPVLNQSQVIGVIAVKVSLSALENSWVNSADPVVLQDNRGIVFLSSEPEWLYRSSDHLSSGDLAWLKLNGQYGMRSHYDILPWRVTRVPGSPTYEFQATVKHKQRSFLALEASLPELAWTLTVTSDLKSVQRARQEALALTTLLAAVLLLAGLYWRLHEQRFVEQLQAKRELEQRVKERTYDLEEAHAFRKAMEDALLVGMRARDPEGRIIYVNRAFCEMVGYSAEELLGCKAPYPYWHPDDLDKYMRQREASLQAESLPHGFESRVRHHDGHDVITQVYTAPLIDRQGRQQGWMSSVVDITAQKIAENRQHEQERQLQRSARLASVGEMASTLAHELNQPLMALSNFAVAARAIAGQAKRELLVTVLEDIVEQSQRASEIVKRVRVFINPQRGSYEDCDVHAVIAHSLTLLKPELQRNLTIVNTQLTENLPHIRGNRVLLEQVLINLLQNAMQATQDLPPARHVIDIETTLLERAILIQIGDRGPGVPEASQEQVFNPFFSTKPDGLGLGLNICRTIVEAHGGHLKVANRKDGGAVFSFTLAFSV